MVEFCLGKEGKSMLIVVSVTSMTECCCVLGVDDLESEGVVGGSGDWEQPDLEVDCWDHIHA
jgi:hypothetical protein